MEYLWALLLLLLLTCGWLTNLFGLPGNWINVAAAAIYWWLMPPESESRVAFGWPVLLVVVLLAIAGELVELAMSAVGVAKLGGSKRGAILAVGGSMVGALLGAIIGLPIPVIGQFVAVLVFASLGAMGGAVLGEYWKGKELGESIQIGHAAFWGRLFGTLGKILAGSVAVMVVIAAMFIQ